MELLFEVLIVLVVLAVVGFFVGVGVLIHQENPKVAEFMKARPVLGWTIAFVTVGMGCYFLLGMFTLLASFVISALLGR